MRFTLAWTLFYIGDLVSRLPHWLHSYPLYRAVMLASCAVQGKGPGPWEEIKAEDVDVAHKS